eukprot:1897312-Pyramimonas_sp.AAC.1
MGGMPSKTWRALARITCLSWRLHEHGYAPLQQTPSGHRRGLPLWPQTEQTPPWSQEVAHERFSTRQE